MQERAGLAVPGPRNRLTSLPQIAASKRSARRAPPISWYPTTSRSPSRRSRHETCPRWDSPIAICQRVPRTRNALGASSRGPWDPWRDSPVSSSYWPARSCSAVRSAPVAWTDTPTPLVPRMSTRPRCVVSARREAIWTTDPSILHSTPTARRKRPRRNARCVASARRRRPTTIRRAARADRRPGRPGRAGRPGGARAVAR
mmetsp:Transcript_33334/g.80622  ORF Transcript_33334/g.80622 Transcript_33334/m.80622 type:complete len:201 (-) Transcript_33334:609-1211(-)